MVPDQLWLRVARGEVKEYGGVCRSEEEARLVALTMAEQDDWAFGPQLIEGIEDHGPYRFGWYGIR